MAGQVSGVAVLGPDPASGPDSVRALSASIPCKVCGDPVEPQETRRGEKKEHCSPRCRARGSRERRQELLDWNPPAHPEPRSSEGQRQTRRTKDRQRLKAGLVLARLRKGPATTWELAETGGIRFGARVYDLRHGVFDGTRYVIHEERLPGQDWSRYWLVER